MLSFPESYNLSIFKSNINKLDLISLFLLNLSSFVGGFAIGLRAFPHHYILKKKNGSDMSIGMKTKIYGSVSRLSGSTILNKAALFF